MQIKKKPLLDLLDVKDNYLEQNCVFEKRGIQKLFDCILFIHQQMHFLLNL